MNAPRTNRSVHFSSHNFVSKICLSGLLLLLTAWPLVAQLSVGPNGLGPLTFDAAPSVAQWSTRSVPGSGDPVTNVAGMDAAVQTNSLALLDAALTTSATLPPTAATRAQWNSTGLFLQTRPISGNSLTLLLARLRNDTGSNLASVTLQYQLAIVLPQGGELSESVAGHRVYFSLTGQTGSWVHIPAFDSASTNDVGLRTASLPLGNWMANSNLYVLWADDNGPGGTTLPIVEGGNTIDNVSLTATPTSPEPFIAVHPASQVVAPGSSVTFTPVVSGAEPLSFQWRKDGQPLPGATNQSLVLPQVSSVDNGSYSFVVSNAYGLATSAPATLEVVCFEPVRLLTNPLSQNLASGGNLLLSVTATGTPPLTYHWSRNGAPLSVTTNGQFQRLNLQVEDAGFYRVAVSNCGGLALSSEVLVFVTPPPFSPLPLVGQVWKYNQSGTDLGTAWRAPEFDDSGWPSGGSLLGVENLASLNPLMRTTLSLTGPGGYLPTYYFRTEFVLDEEPADVSLVASNYFDDGGIVYLNGSEFVRFNMPAGNVGYQTLATFGNPLGEGVFFVTNVPSQLLRRGTNYLAAEVHQFNLGSSDIVFGLQLLGQYRPLSPLQITNQPLDASLEAGQPLQLTAGVSGPAARYQWFKDGAAISGATSSSLRFAQTTGADAGVYLLRARNPLSEIFSRFVTVQVNQDLTGPQLVAAEILSVNEAMATFSEPVLPESVTNLWNLVLTNTLGEEAFVLNAMLLTPTNLWLTTEGFAGDRNYILSLSNVLDLAQPANRSPQTTQPLLRTAELVSDSHAWRYLEAFSLPPGLGDDTQWAAPEFDDSTWISGAGAFAYGTASSPVPVNTSLNLTPNYTTFFRTTFVSPFSQAGLQLQLSYVLDDGACFYLNGREFHRVNLPSGDLRSDTPAEAPVVAELLSASVSMPAELPNSGTNHLAVRLQQAKPEDIDKLLAVRVTARGASLVGGPVNILRGPLPVTAVENQPVRFDAIQIGGERFQWQLAGTNLPLATNAILVVPAVPLPWNALPMRLVVWNAESAATSSVAQLSISPDYSPPQLISALAESEGTVRLRFDEVISQDSAHILSAYVITNAVGEVFQPTNVLWLGAELLLELPSLPARDHVVVMNGLRDASVAANPIRPGTSATVGFNRRVISWAQPWRFEGSGADLTGTSWMAIDFDDQGWFGPGPGLLDAKVGGRSPATLPFPVGTILPAPTEHESGHYLNTMYFRTEFRSLAGGRGWLNFQTVIDDSWILYLNGVEVQRVRLPTGPINYSTRGPSSGFGDAFIEGPFRIEVTNLVAGENVLAVEEHQFGSASSDTTLGLQMSVELPSVVTAPLANEISLGFRSWGPSHLLEWKEPGAVLETAPSTEGPWLPSPGSTGLLLITPTNPTTFYRLRL